MSDDTPRLGRWMGLSSGKKFHPLDPRPGDFDIADIAHALSNICRYGGHVARFYSVAEHSVHVARLMPPPLRFAALLHDAAEAYLGDIPRPLKSSAAFAPWRAAEAAMEAAIGAQFGIAFPMHPAIAAVDDRIILDEWDQLKPTIPRASIDIGVSGQPLGVTLWCLSPAEAEAEFLAACRRFAPDHPAGHPPSLGENTPPPSPSATPPPPSGVADGRLSSEPAA